MVAQNPVEIDPVSLMISMRETAHLSISTFSKIANESLQTQSIKEVSKEVVEDLLLKKGEPISEGGYGKLYKVLLKSRPDFSIAVKEIEIKDKDCEDQIRKEIEFLTKTI